MKTLIIYDSQKGFTKECAQFIKDNIEQAELKALSDVTTIDQYDELYLGTYIINGAISSKMQKFLKKEYVQLLNKKLKMFISALDMSDYYNALQTSIDPELFYRAEKINCGGRIVFKELSLLERRKVKKFMDIDEDKEVLYLEKLLELIKK